MENVQGSIDALRSDHEEANSRMFEHVSHVMELYSLGGLVMWNMVKLTLIACDLTMKKHVRECLPMFQIQRNYSDQEELLYGT